MAYARQICLLFLLFVGASFSIKLPSYVPACCLTDPKLNECILKSAEAIRPHLRDGMEELGTSTFNPLFVKQFRVAQNAQGLEYNASLSNVTYGGFANYSIASLSYDPKTLKLTGVFHFDQVSFSGLYDVIGKFITFYTEADGDFVGSLVTCSTTFELTGKIAKRKGVDFYHPTEFTFLLEIEDFKIHVTGLFKQNKQLGDIINVFLNDNGKEIVQELAPTFTKIFREDLWGYVNYITKEIAYNDIFPC